MKAARDGSLLPEQTGNAVATLTNLGPQNVDFFTPILNFPETVILGVGRMNTVPWVEDDKITTAKTIGFSLTFDHQGNWMEKTRQTPRRICEGVGTPIFFK